MTTKPDPQADPKEDAPAVVERLRPISPRWATGRGYNAEFDVRNQAEVIERSRLHIERNQLQEESRRASER